MGLYTVTVRRVDGTLVGRIGPTGRIRASIVRRTIHVRVGRAALVRPAYKASRYDISGRQILYKGRHADASPLDSAPDWAVWKYEWASGVLLRRIGPLTGAWTDRASLAWG